jgi:hypothetical protein
VEQQTTKEREKQLEEVLQREQELHFFEERMQEKLKS